MDIYPEPPGTKIDEVQNFSTHLGGSAANTCVALSKLNVASDLVTCVSNDAIGNYIFKKLDDFNIGNKFCRRIDKKFQTQMAVVETILENNQSILYRNNSCDLQLEQNDIERINFEDNESKKIAARGLIVKNFCDFPSNYRSKMSLEDFLVEQKTICISDIDTRHLTRILRDEGCKIGAIYPTKLFTDEEAVSEIKKFGSMSDNNFIENPIEWTLINNNTDYLEYTIQKGDVLSEIAIRFGVTVDSINKTNNLENKSIFPGQIIRIEI